MRYIQSLSDKLIRQWRTVHCIHAPQFLDLNFVLTAILRWPLRQQMMLMRLMTRIVAADADCGPESRTGIGGKALDRMLAIDLGQIMRRLLLLLLLQLIAVAISPIAPVAPRWTPGRGRRGVGTNGNSWRRSCHRSRRAADQAGLMASHRGVHWLPVDQSRWHRDWVNVRKKRQQSQRPRLY